MNIKVTKMRISNFAIIVSVAILLNVMAGNLFFLETVNAYDASAFSYLPTTGDYVFKHVFNDYTQGSTDPIFSQTVLQDAGGTRYIAPADITKNFTIPAGVKNAVFKYKLAFSSTVINTYNGTLFQGLNTISSNRVVYEYYNNRYWRDNGTAVGLQLTLDAWYTITIVVDLVNKKYDLYNGATGTKDQGAFSNSKTTIDNLRFLTSASPYNCKIAEMSMYTVPENAPTAVVTLTAGDIQIGSTISGSYTYNDTNSDTEAGSTYRWVRSTDGSTWTEITAAAAISAGQTKTYSLTDTDAAAYINMEITPRNAAAINPNGVPTVAVTPIGRVVAPPSAPTALDVTITGKPITGGLLTGTYKYFDKNLDSEAGSEYRWLSDNNNDGIYENILASGIVNDHVAGTEYLKTTYQIKEQDFDKKIILEITPKTSVEPMVGTPVRSNVLELSAMAPNVSEVTIDGSSVVGMTLTGRYRYNDENGDPESTTGSIYRWLISSQIDGTYTPISGASAISYVITKSDANNYIKFEVTPKSSIAPYTGVSVASNASSLIAGLPEALNVHIEGSCKPGNTVRGVYEYYDANNNKEVDSTYRWLTSNSESGPFNAINGATGTDYLINGSDAESYLVFEVTPKTFIEPMTGETKQSNAVLINKNVTIIRSTGGSSGGSSGKSIITNPPIPIESKDLFKDIKDHWAKADIEYLASEKVIFGTDSEHFSPEQNISRAEFTALVVRALKLSTIKANNSFIDIKDGEWYSDVIQTAADNKIISGNGEEFRPNDFINREEMTKVIVNAYLSKNQQKVSGSLAQFADKEEISSWAVDYVSSAVELGLIKGMEQGLFEPKENATRAQAATIIKRLVEKLGN